MAAAERLGPIINPEILVRFAAATREMLRNEDGTLRCDLLRAVAQRVEITSPTSADMMVSRIELLRILAAIIVYLAYPRSSKRATTRDLTETVMTVTTCRSRQADSAIFRIPVSRLKKRRWAPE